MRKLLLVFILLFGITSYGQMYRKNTNKIDSYIIYQGDEVIAEGHCSDIVLNSLMFDKDTFTFWSRFHIGKRLVSKDYQIDHFGTYQALGGVVYTKQVTTDDVIIYEYNGRRLIIIEDIKSGYVVYLYNRYRHNPKIERIFPNAEGNDRRLSEEELYMMIR